MKWMQTLSYRCPPKKIRKPVLVIILIIMVLFTSGASPYRWINILPIPTDVTASVGLPYKIELNWKVACDLNIGNFEIIQKPTDGSIWTVAGTIPYSGCGPAFTYHYDVWMDGYTDFAYRNYDFRIKTCPGSNLYCDDVSEKVSGSAIISPPYISATNGTFEDKIEISFFEYGGFNARAYKVYRSATSDGTYVYLGNTNGDSTYDGIYEDMVFSAGTTYYYKGEICNSYGCSEMSTNYAVGSTASSGPSSINASDGTYGRYINIDWEAVDNANEYRIYRSLTDTPPDNFVSTTSTNYGDTGTEPYTTYYYWVSAYNFVTIEWTPLSESDSGWRPYAPPNNVFASAGTKYDGIDISWVHADQDPSVYYLIYRAASASSEDSTKVGSSSDTAFTDTLALPGKTYYYWVKACDNTQRCSTLAGPADGYTLLREASNLQASDGNSVDHVALYWDPVYGATSYKIFRSTSNSIPGSPQITVSGDSHYDTSAAVGISYYYWVKACSDEMICGSASNADTGWRDISAATNFQASDGTNTSQVEITWDSSPGADTYMLYRASTESGDKTLLNGTLTDTSFTDTTVSPGAYYFYWVKSCMDLGCSDFSTMDSGYRAVTAPTNLSASDGTSVDHVALTWNPVLDATSYKIYRNTTNSIPGSPQNTVTGGESHIDASAALGTSYYYWVEACIDAICSSASNADTGWRNITAAANLQASDGTSTSQVEITWDSSPGADTYMLYRASTESGDQTLLDGTLTGTSFTDTTVSPGEFYFYWVKSCIDLGCSDLSAMDSGYRAVTAPTNLNASDGEYDQVSLSWDPVASADHYEVYRAESLGGAKTTLKSNETGTSYLDTSMTPGDRYEYSVKACVVSDTTICSDFSGETSGWARGGTLPVVTSIRRADSDPTNQDGVSFTVEFNKDVENVDVTDFALTTTGISGESVVSVTSVTAAQWMVEVNTGTGSGTIRLDLLDDNSIVDLDVDNALGGPTLGDGDFTSGDVYTVDKEAPSLTAIKRGNPAEEITNADTLVFEVEFSENVLAMEDDFSINGGSTAVIDSVIQVSALIYEVTVSGGDLADYNGTVGIDLTETQDIIDDAGNTLVQDEPETNESYLIDNVPPTVSLAAGAEPGGSCVLLEVPWQPEVVFGENVLHDGSDQAANNANNYLLFQAGLNGQYDITNCSDAANDHIGDDLLFPVGPAVYEDNKGEGPFVTTLTVNNGEPLPLGKYRLMVCGTTSIADLAGNKLNGSISDELVNVSVIRQYIFPIWFH